METQPNLESLQLRKEELDEQYWDTVDLLARIVSERAEVMNELRNSAYYA